MKTLAELNAALALATGTIQYMRTLTGAAETFAGDGIGFGTLGNAISLGIIVTNGRNDFIDGAGGNDTIRGYGGSDILVGGAGNDYLFGGPGSYGSNFSVDSTNFLFGDTESVDPTVTQSTDGNDLMAGGSANDYLFGGGGNDVLYGGNFANGPGSGNDYLSGGVGNDILIPGDGTNQVDGGTTVPVSLFMPGLTGANPPVTPAAPPEVDVFRSLSSSNYSFAWNDTGKYVQYNSGDGQESDQIVNVEFADVSPVAATVNSITIEPLTQLLPITEWTIQIRRYENGAGSLQLLMNGVPVPGAMWTTEDRGSSNPLSLVETAGVFAFDDTTPIPAGTYQAIYRTDARSAKIDGPGTIELLGTGSLAVFRSAIQIHQLGNNAGFTTSSQGCYTIPLDGIQRIENLIRLFSPQAAELTESASSIGVANGITSGLALGAAPIKYWDLFWRDLTVSQQNYTSQISVQITDISTTLIQPTVQFGTATRSGAFILVPFNVRDGSDNKVSKDIRLDLQLVGAAAGTAFKNTTANGATNYFVIKAGTSQGVLKISTTTDSPFSVKITGVTPLSKTGAPYDEYESGGRQKLLQLFVGDAASRVLSVIPSTLGAAPPLSVDASPTGHDVSVTDTASLAAAATLDWSGSYDTLVSYAEASSPVPVPALFRSLAIISSPPLVFTMPAGLEVFSHESSTSIHVIGTASSDVIRGGTGNDLIEGGGGADVLGGGGGQDIFEGSLSDLNGDEIIDPLAGDSILVDGVVLGATQVHVVQSTQGEDTSDVVIDLDGSGTNLTVIHLDVPLATFSATGWSLQFAAQGSGTALTFVANAASLPTLSITANQSGLAEGNSGVTPFLFTVSRTGDSSSVVSVDYSVAGAAVDAADFGDTVPYGTITFDAGVTTQTIEIDVSGDTVAEPDEAFQVILANPAGGQIGTATATSTIVNDDGAPCYCPGTLIATECGQRAIETLCVGDSVLTVSGGPETIQWIGVRRYDGRFIRDNHLMLPVTFLAGSLDDGIPFETLTVSPGHAMWVDGALVPAWRLVNGRTITQATAVDEVTYIHLELGRHALLLANGAAAESFINEAGFRGRFQSTSCHDGFDPDATATAPFHARLEDGFDLLRIQERLADRAHIVPSIEPAGCLRGYVDHIEPGLVSGWAQDVDSPEQPVELVVYIGNVPAGTVLANGWRDDLRRAGMGSGCHAFHTRVPLGSRAISVRRLSDGALLQRTEAAESLSYAA